MKGLVLSLFPGIDLLGMAFEAEGFCVVRGPDVIYGGDIRGFHPPAGRFDGVIGGPPCQAFSRLAHLNKKHGRMPMFGNLIPEYERCVEEAAPAWFVMENVPDAPVPSVAGYGVHSFLLNNRQLGEKQHRVRRWSFGHCGRRLVLGVETVVFEHPEFEYAAVGGAYSSLAVRDKRRKLKTARLKSRSALPFNTRSVHVFRENCRKQGLPDTFDLPGFTIEGKCRAIGNGVPLPMGRAIARAVAAAISGGGAA